MSFFSKPQLKAAAHTLWQAAVATGGPTAVVEAVVQPKVDWSAVQQGGAVAGIAVLASALSLAKATAANWLVAHKASKVAKAAAETEELAKAVAAYNAQHAAPVDAPVADPTVVHSL